MLRLHSLQNQFWKRRSPKSRASKASSSDSESETTTCTVSVSEHRIFQNTSIRATFFRKTVFFSKKKYPSFSHICLPVQPSITHCINQYWGVLNNFPSEKTTYRLKFEDACISIKWYKDKLGSAFYCDATLKQLTWTCHGKNISLCKNIKSVVYSHVIMTNVFLKSKPIVRRNQKMKVLWNQIECFSMKDTVLQYARQNFGTLSSSCYIIHWKFCIAWPIAGRRPKDPRDPRLW